MKKSRSQIFRDLNVKPTNPRWSWCAKNIGLKISVFTIWEDKEDENGVWLLHDDNVVNRRPGYRDQKETLILSLTQNFTAYGLVAEAVDPNDSPRSIRHLYDEYLVKLRLVKKDNRIYAKKNGEIPYLDAVRKSKSILEKHGVLDLDNPPIGKDVADRALRSGYVFKRDQKVRKHVLNRADGKCEYCGELGFEMESGESYLETHHIIALANQGADKLENVIALCPNHHREAHFGMYAEDLEKQFIRLLENK